MKTHRTSRARRGLIGLLAAISTLALGAGSASAFEPLGVEYGVGYPESGNGQLITPMGVAVAPDGTVVVADIVANRVSVFSQSGRFLRAFGKDVSYGGGAGPEVCVTDCKMGVSGVAAGELGAPWGIAASATEIYVAEVANNRVSAFDFEGRFLRAFGGDVGGPGVDVCTTTCGPGTPGPESGQFLAPAGAALDASGKLLVGELGGYRVDVFDPVSGQFLRAFGKDVGGPGVGICTTTCTTGSTTPEPGSVISPASLSVAPSGEIFVTDQANARVSVFGADGTFRRQFGSEGTGSGQLDEPHGVVANGNGVFVADYRNDRLALFGEAGDFRGAFGFDVIPGPPLGAEFCTTLCQPGTANFGIGSFVEPRGIATDCRGAVYVGMIGRVEKWGEPGVAAPPCPPPAPPAPPAPQASPKAPAKPSNAIKLGKLTLNKKKGTATLELTVPGPGTLKASAGKKMTAKAPVPKLAGKLKVTIKAKGKGTKALNESGKLKGTLRLTYTPSGGDPNTVTRKLTLSKTGPPTE